MWWLATQQSPEAFKTTSPHGDQAPCNKRHGSLLKGKKTHKREEQKQLSKAITSSNVSVPRASFSVPNCIGEAKKHFTLGKELIMPAPKDIYHELLGEVASQLVGEDLYTEMRWLSEGRLLANSYHWQHISVTQNESINLFNLFEELSPPSQERTTVFSWQTK